MLTIRGRLVSRIVASLAITILLCTPSASQQQSHRGYWYHNGSTVYLIARGNVRQFYYQEPRPGMVEAGARPDSLLFDGIMRNGSYYGIAYNFNAHCGIYPYRVSGPILDNYERVVLRGRAPRVGPNCEVQGYFEEALEFRLLRSGDVPASRKLPNAGEEGASGTQPSPNKSDEAQRGSGTGFFVASNGYIVTNNHVIENCRSIMTVDGPSNAIAHVIARDKTNDLAILKVELSSAKVPSLRKAARLGETIYVYGFPLSGLLSTSGNFTVGSITALSGLADDSRMYQISAPVQLGNSGGPVIDKAGNVVGIIVGKLNALGVASVTLDLPQNINFAIKSSILDNFLNSNEVIASGTEKSDELQPEEIASYAKSFTVKVLCN